MKNYRMTLICDDLRNEDNCLFFVTNIKAKNDYQASLEVAREVEFLLKTVKDIRMTVIQLDELIYDVDDCSGTYDIVYRYEISESTEEVWYGDILMYS